MPSNFGNNENLTPQELQQLEDGLRVLRKIIAMSFKDESVTIGTNPQKLKLDVPELLDTSNGKLALSPREVATALGVSQTTVYEQIHQGQIPVVKWGRKILIPKVALAKMLAEAKPQIG
jgi:excisionase family DNA binding protein